MRSVYWKYFGFPAYEDGTILTKEKIVCIMCKTQMIYNRNTSNLRMHLSSKHKNVLQNIDLTEGDKIRRPKKPKVSRSFEGGDVELHSMGMMTGGGGRKNSPQNKDVQLVMSEEVSETDISNIAIIFPGQDEMHEYNGVDATTQRLSAGSYSNETSEAILNFIVTDLVPPSVVDGKGFHNLISSLLNRTTMIPNEKKLLEDFIPQMYNVCKEQTYNLIVSNCVTSLSLSVEEWINIDNLKFVSVYMHYLVNGESRLFTRLLTTVYCTGSEQADYWIQLLDKLFEEWNINPSLITAVLVSFNIPELSTALLMKNLTLVPCFLFVLQNLSEEIFGHPDVSLILEKCRCILKYLQETKISIYEIFAGDPEDEEFDDNDDYSLYYDNPRIWLSTFYLMRGIQRRQNVILDVATNVNPKIQECLLNETEWKQLQDVVDLFEPLKTVVITLFEERTSLISLLRPLIWKVSNSNYDLHEEDSALCGELKLIVRKGLSNAYADENVEFLTQISTALDPRFKVLPQDESFNCDENLTILLTNLIDTEGSKTPEEYSVEKTSAKKQNRLSGINVLFGNFQAKKFELTKEEKVKLEINHYKTESGALLEECPLEWWQRMSNKCPNLIRLAQKYHCVPSSTVLNGNQSVRDYLLFYHKRASLKQNTVDSLLFLNSNRAIL